MATSNIKNLPDSLHRRLQKRAELHHRSVAQEVTHILEETLERPEPLSIRLEPLFASIANGGRRAVTSALTLLEVLDVPFRVGNLSLADRYEALLTRSRGLRLVELDRGQLRAAAQLRAVHPQVRTPDALQLAAATAGECSALITNDRDIPSLPGLRVLQLNQYARPE